MILTSTAIAVRCPCKRMLFKWVRGSGGTVEVKCPRCGLLNEVTLDGSR